MARSNADVIAIHDPELIPAGVIARWLRGVPVILDLHEDFPAQILTKSSVPRWLRRPLASVARLWLVLADRTLEITLAEDGYRELFRSTPPVFANYPDSFFLPEPTTATRAGVVYIGDITEQRGAMTLLEAAADAGVGPVVYVGRCPQTLRRRLLELATERNVEIELRGWLPYPEAMDVAGNATVGVSPLHDTPNYRHSLPTKTLEYLAMGTPVVASDLPGTAQVIRGLPGVRLVSPGDVAALAEALRSINAQASADAIDGSSAIRLAFQWPADEVKQYYLSLVFP
jgi:glycosyltransferase involved in cell wall biosynthesis